MAKTVQKKQSSFEEWLRANGLLDLCEEVGKTLSKKRVKADKK